MKLIVEYSGDGICVPDAKIDELVTNLISIVDFKNNLDDKEYHIQVASELIITALRVKVLAGEIPYTQIEFKFEDKIIKINKDGRLDWWPKGFCDYNDHYLDQLLNL